MTSAKRAPDDSTTSRTSKRVRMQVSDRGISLSPEEDRFCSMLDSFAKAMRASEQGQETLELRIAGGWVRDKLLGLPSHDLDVAISSMTGQAFANRFLSYLASSDDGTKDGLKLGKLTTIAARPDQSKHLETATTRLLGLELDFVQLRSEEYGGASRIPDRVAFGTPLQDALRRDITINSLFYNVHSCAVEDHTQKGLDDLRSGLVRTPLPAVDTFRDDPLRLLRCIRFASRFGFELDPGIASAARDGSIRAAFTEKISRERVGTEVEKMLKGPDPTRAIELIDSLSLYPLVFSAPPHSTFPPTRPPDHAAVTASSILRSLLDPASSTRLHPELAKLSSAPEVVRKRLYLASALLPYRHAESKVGKRTVWSGSLVIGDSLKLGNHDRDFVDHLFSAADQLSSPDPSRFGDPSSASSQRVAIGSVLRRPDVHDLRSADEEAKSTWQASTLFSLVVEAASMPDERGRAGAVEKYNAFVEKVVELGLPKCLTPDFERSRLDGNEICSTLGVKPGKFLAGIIANVVERQLAVPDESKDEAKGWLKAEVEAGRISTSR